MADSLVLLVLTPLQHGVVSKRLARDPQGRLWREYDLTQYTYPCSACKRQSGLGWAQSQEPPPAIHQSHWQGTWICLHCAILENGMLPQSASEGPYEGEWQI